MSLLAPRRPPAAVAAAARPSQPAPAPVQQPSALRLWRGNGLPPGPALGRLQHIADTGATLLAGEAGGTDAWLAGGTLHSGRTGALHWQHNGHWLWGTLALAEAADPSVQADLAGTVRQAYADVFSTLRDTGFAHPQRLWNYLADIHGDDLGLERYRRFNAARQQAFLDAGLPAFDGAPAACCLGVGAGHPLRVHLLAARRPALPVENPRQVSAYRYPADYGPRAPTFSRAALQDAGDGAVLLLVSGTASIVGHASLHAGDLAAQTDETLRNLQAVIDAAHQRTSARFRLSDLALTAYLRHPAQADALRRQLADRLGTHSPAVQQLVLLQAEVCRADLLVEIEAHGLADGEVLR